MIQHFKDGKEYTTRHKLSVKYKIPKRGGLLQNILEDIDLTRIQELNQFYFLKNEVELILEKAINDKSANIKNNIK